MSSEPEKVPLNILPEHLSESAYLQWKKLECNHLLARLGLQGTLWGALGSLFTLLVIVFLPLFFASKPIVEGWQVVALVAVFVVPIMAYGAYVFERALKLSAGEYRAEVPPATRPNV